MLLMQPPPDWPGPVPCQGKSLTHRLHLFDLSRVASQPRLLPFSNFTPASSWSFSFMPRIDQSLPRLGESTAQDVAAQRATRVQLKQSSRGMPAYDYPQPDPFSRNLDVAGTENHGGKESEDSSYPHGILLPRKHTCCAV